MTRHRFHWLMFGFLLSLAFVADAKAMFAPSIGRTLSRDPIEFEGSQWNLYEIANSRIHTGLDPSGMCEVEKCKDTDKGPRTMDGDDGGDCSGNSKHQ